MNKWMVRFWGFVTLGAFIALVVSTAWAREPATSPAPDDEAEEQQLLDAAHEHLRKEARNQPDALRVVRVQLRRGLSAEEVGALLTHRSLGLASLEARLPLSDGNVITMGSNLLGPFPRFPGTITEQVEKVLGRWRLNYLRRAQQEGDTNQGRLAREAALSRELGVYELEVWGSLRFLCELLDEPDVRGVVPFAGAELAAHYDQQRLEMEAQPVIRGPTTRIPIPTDPNAQLPELPPDILEQPVQ